MENWAKLPRMPNEINIIPSFKIDRTKWDTCISESSNALIYATTMWLDHLADHWSGIVLNDYEAVMPVPWRSKLGVRYCYHVAFIQQLGIFCGKKNSDEKSFLDPLFSICSYGDYPFNFANSIGKTDAFTNYILHLAGKYEDVAKGFSGDV